MDLDLMKKLSLYIDNVSEMLCDICKERNTCTKLPESSDGKLIMPVCGLGEPEEYVDCSLLDLEVDRILRKR